MLFRQLLDPESRTLTYLVASCRGAEALLIDPVLEQVPLYLRLLEALDLRLALAIDTHSHTEHTSALQALAEGTGCVSAMGERNRTAPVTRHLSDGEVVILDGLELRVMHTPGHTSDSYCILMDDRVFTGDTLLIGGTGRTDQQGDPRQQYGSLFGKLLQLPGRTLVYPGHDYSGRHVSSIADERRDNPRLQAESADAYAAMMDRLRPADPRLMDVAARSSLSPSAPLMRELLRLRSALRAEHRLGVDRSV